MQIKVQQWMTTRGSYVHKTYGKILMLVLFFQFSKNFLMASDKTIHKAFTIHRTLINKAQ